MKMLTVSHKPTKTTQFFQDRGHSPHLCRSRCNWRSWARGDHLRSDEVTICFSSINRGRIEIETRKWCQTTWFVKPLRKICILTYLGHDLTFQGQKYMFRTGSARRTRWCHFHFCVSLIKKVINEKPSRWKAIFVIWWPLEPKLLTYAKSDKKTWPGHEASFPMFFFLILPR